MTVAAVLHFDAAHDALTDTAGRPAVRRMVEAAWAGGATPIVVVSEDPTGAVASALAGSPAVLAEPAPGNRGAAAHLARGFAVATAQVAETDAALLWPGRMGWVDAETVTSLIELHGVERDLLLRPHYADQAGWPVLLPAHLGPRLATLATELTTEQLIERLVSEHGLSLFDTGDPGTVHESTVALAEMPPYAGPPEPARSAPEWGVAAADLGEDRPLEGPALAPYGQAADPETD